MKRFFAALAAIMIFTLAAAPALAVNVVQPTGYYASDFASALSAEAKNHIEVNAKALESATGAQIAFVTLRTTSPNTIKDYANVLFSDWKIGDAKKNNGILVILAVGDDDYFIQEGTGLERNLPPSDLSNLVNDYLEPDFALKEYSTASIKIFDALFAKVASIYGANLSIDNSAKASYYGYQGSTTGSNYVSRGASGATAPSGDGGSQGGGMGIGGILVVLGVVVVFLSLFGGMRGGSGCLPGLLGGWLGGMMTGPRRGGRGGFGGGGFGGGGFGGGGSGGGGSGGGFSGGGGRSRGSGVGRSGGGFGGGGFSGGGGSSRGAGVGRKR